MTDSINDARAMYAVLDNIDDANGEIHERRIQMKTSSPIQSLFDIIHDGFTILDIRDAMRLHSALKSAIHNDTMYLYTRYDLASDLATEATVSMLQRINLAWIRYVFPEALRIELVKERISVLDPLVTEYLETDPAFRKIAGRSYFWAQAALCDWQTVKGLWHMTETWKKVV